MFSGGSYTGADISVDICGVALSLSLLLSGSDVSPDFESISFFTSTIFSSTTGSTCCCSANGLCLAVERKFPILNE